MQRGYDVAAGPVPAVPAADAGRSSSRTVGGTVWLFCAIPKGFFPQEDIGQLSVSTEARAGHLLRGHGRAAAAGRGGASALAPCGPRGLDRRRRRRQQLAQQRPPVRRAEAADRAAAAGRRCWPTCAANWRRIPASAPSCTPVQNLQLRRPLRRAASTSSSCRASTATELYDWAQKLADAMQQRPRPSPTSPPTSQNSAHAGDARSSTGTRPARSASPPTSCARRSIQRLRHAARSRPSTPPATTTR